MSRLTTLLAILILATVSAYPQSHPEMEALREVFFAKDIETASIHLPTSLQEALAHLPQQERTEVGQQFLMLEQAKREGANVTRSEDASVLAIVEISKDRTQQLVLSKRISDGSESVLWFGLRDQQAKNTGEQPFQVSMRFVDGVWQVHEVVFGYRSIKLDDPELIQTLLHSHENANEASAIGSLRTYNTACITYASTYPDIGFPRDLNVLGSDGTDNASSEHSMLMDTILTSPPYEKSGYRFTYRRVSLEAYQVFARPLEFGKSGRRGFYTDESGVIRFTEEDREPTSEDPPLQ